MNGSLLHFDGQILHATSLGLARRWRLVDGVLQALSLTDVGSGREWITPLSEPSLVPPGGAPQAPCTVSWAVTSAPALPVEAPSQRATLTVRGADGRGYHLHLQVFTAGLGITCRLESFGNVAERVVAATVSTATGVELADAQQHRDSTVDLCERLHLVSAHLDLVEVTLQDQTDGHDNLAHERRWCLTPASRPQLRTCLIALEDPLTRSGLLIVRHAPLPHVRPVMMVPDVQAVDRDVRLVGHGCGDTGQGYAWTVLPFRDGAWGRATALHGWQRCLRAYVPGRDGRLLTNTWGDRNRDGRITAEFIAQEITAGAALGADICQIDDGWQRGISANSVDSAKGGVWIGFWAADPQFWDANAKRFPQGLAPIAAAATAAGINLGLWFAPDSADDFANWRRDADAVLHLHRTYRVGHVKIDGVKAHTKLSEDNLRRFLHAVLHESAGRVSFDLDITAEVRPGYFGAVEVGPLFVENRYTDWRRYWPHHTLRSLWQLAWHIPPQRLRMEFLNPSRHADKYAGDPLAPAAYPLDYALASVLVAEPLGWFEVSSLPPAMATACAALLTVWKQHRAALHGGTILPIGMCPDGTSWTGFCSVGSGVAHVLVFREQHTEAAMSLALPPGVVSCSPLTTLAGRGAARWDGDRLRVAIPTTLDWVWVRLGA